MYQEFKHTCTALFCPLILLFSDVAAAVAVVVFLSSLYLSSENFQPFQNTEGKTLKWVKLGYIAKLQNTKQLFNIFTTTFPSIVLDARLDSLESEGLGDAINAGLNWASSTYIWFLLRCCLRIFLELDLWQVHEGNTDRLYYSEQWSQAFKNVVIWIF